jgi:hypothetical protein
MMILTTEGSIFI